MIYNQIAIDYSKGTYIIDPITNKIYTNEEILQESQSIKSRTIIRGNVIGCYVMDLDDLEKLRKQNESKNKIFKNVL